MTDLTHTFGLVNANAKINLEESIEELNALHQRLKRGVNTDLELLEEMKELLDFFKYVYQPQPIEIAFGLVVKDKEYVQRFRNYWNLLTQKFQTTQEGRFEDAAKLRDEA